MTYKDVTQLPLWEHAAESGRFAEYMGAAGGFQPWSLLGKGLISSLTLIGGVADVVHFGMWSSSAEPAVEVTVEGDRAAMAASPAGQPENYPAENRLK